MTSDDRLTWGFITDVLDVLQRHGYHRGDNEHTGQAIGLIRDVAHIYEGTLDAPRGSYVVVPSPQPTAPQPPGPPAAVVVSADQVKILLAALDDAAGYKRDRAETCADCAGRSCTTCQWRLQTAGAYDQLAEQMTQAAEASAPSNARPATRRPTLAGRTRPPTGRPDSDLASDSPSPVHHWPATAGAGMKQPDDSDSRSSPGSRRPPDYAVVISASDWVKEHFPAAGANLWDALRTGHDRHRDPEPDLEAEP